MDATEHAHVSKIKDPAWHTNNNDYDPQISHHLDREEKLCHFAVATSLKSSYTDPDLKELREDEGDENEEENGEDDEPIDPTAIHLNCNPTYTGLKIDEVADRFNIPDLCHALSDFLQHDARNGDDVFGVGVPRRLLIDCPEGIGYFIDFDHTSIIKEGETFTVSFGTGTIPYVSMRILKKMSKNADVLRKSKMTIDTKKNHDSTNSFAQLELIEHNASDDLESLFYIFFEFISKYNGAHGILTQTWDKTTMPWADAYENLDATSSLLTTFLAKKGAMSKGDILMDRVSGYFVEFKPIVDKWCTRIYHMESNIEGTIVHKHIFQMLAKFIAKLDDEEPAPLSSPLLPVAPPSAPIHLSFFHATFLTKAAAQRSSRPNHGVGSHAVQLRRAGETVAATLTRKGLRGDNLQISSSEENPMAPLQVQKGKKNPPAKPHSTSKKNLKEHRTTESSQHSQALPSHPNPYVAHSSERFGFKESQPNGHKMVGWNGQRCWFMMFLSVIMQRMGSEKLLHQPICQRERKGHILLIAHNPLIDTHPNVFIPNLLTHILLNTSGARSPMFVLNLLAHILLNASGTYLHIVPLIQSLHISNHLIKSNMYALHPHQTKGQDKPGESLEAEILSTHLASIPADGQDALNLAQEVLDTVLWIYHEKKIKLKRGYFPEYDMQMCQLGSTMQKEEAQWQVTTATAKLFKSGDYLWLPDSSGEIFKNFMAQVLKDACLEFYYSNTAVLKGVISGFHDTGTDKVPELTAEQCRTHFVNLWKSVDTPLDIPEHHEELKEMLEQWARISMGDFNECTAGSVMSSDTEDVNIIL
ncbi:hypothetical protein F4604DRAFT_1675108 [Suillus subluteus]|nr:hypothetical protein F4604DRAFT_1675108 [Suillus subluteus]